MLQQFQRALRKIAHSARANCSHFGDCHYCELPLAAIDRQQLASTASQQPLPLPQRSQQVGAKRLASRLERSLCAQASGRLAAPQPPLRSARGPQTLAASDAGRPALADARSSSRRALTSSGRWRASNSHSSAPRTGSRSSAAEAEGEAEAASRSRLTQRQLTRPKATASAADEQTAARRTLT